MTASQAAALTAPLAQESYFAVAYAANDVILIVLWLLASATDSRYLSVAVCFVAFLFNDVYGFFSWQKMKRRQMALLTEPAG